MGNALAHGSTIQCRWVADLLIQSKHTQTEKKNKNNETKYFCGNIMLVVECVHVICCELKWETATAYSVHSLWAFKWIFLSVLGFNFICFVGSSSFWFFRFVDARVLWDYTLVSISMCLKWAGSVAFYWTLEFFVFLISIMCVSHWTDCSCCWLRGTFSMHAFGFPVQFWGWANFSVCLNVEFSLLLLCAMGTTIEWFVQFAVTTKFNGWMQFDRMWIMGSACGRFLVSYLNWFDRKVWRWVIVRFNLRIFGDLLRPHAQPNQSHAIELPLPDGPKTARAWRSKFYSHSNRVISTPFKYKNTYYYAN